jgi:hypothetical protein
MGVKTSLKESTRAKGQLRIDQQKALREQKKAGRSSSFGSEPAKKAPARKAKTIKPKQKDNTVGGLADKLRRRGRF